jgi:hypothetical protein
MSTRMVKQNRQASPEAHRDLEGRRTSGPLVLLA